MDTMLNQSSALPLPTPIGEPACVTPAPADVEDRVTRGWPGLDEMSLRYIFEVLAHVAQNKTRAARLLGIDRRTLTRILARAHGNRTPAMHTRP